MAEIQCRKVSVWSDQLQDSSLRNFKKFILPRRVLRPVRVHRCWPEVNKSWFFKKFIKNSICYWNLSKFCKIEFSSNFEGQTDLTYGKSRIFPKKCFQIISKKSAESISKLFPKTVSNISKLFPKLPMQFRNWAFWNDTQNASSPKVLASLRQNKVQNVCSFFEFFKKSGFVDFGQQMMPKCWLQCGLSGSQNPKMPEIFWRFTE